MNSYMLALGSNLGDRKQHLLSAIELLKREGSIDDISPCFENPPLLPPGAPKDWYHFFLNCVVIFKTTKAPLELLKTVKRIESELGRTENHEKWCPRQMDIDLICQQNPSSRDEIFSSNALTIPHPAWSERNFVISPLNHLAPHLKIARTVSASEMTPQNSVIEISRQLAKPLPALMAILNITPDSFSNSEKTLNIETKIAEFKNRLESDPAFIDIGAESTRPHAQSLSAPEEWDRLLPFLELWKDIKGHYPFTKLSLDTYHFQTAQKSLDYGVDILNDVSGLSTPEMQEVASNFKKVILMHSLSVPADPQITLPEDRPAHLQIAEWLSKKLFALKTIPQEKIIFDPGLGFGKTPLQSLELLRNMTHFHQFDLLLLSGHSRKSFMNLWSEQPYSERDPETLGASLFLTEKQIDILRVHNLPLHKRALQSHLALRGPS